MSLSYRIAMQSLRMNRARTGLTTLGIIIGVASVTLVLALGGGAEDSVRTQVSKLGNNVVLATSKVDTPLTEAAQQYNPYGISATTSLTEHDLNTISISSYTQHVAPIMVLNGSASGTFGTRQNIPIIATTSELATILGFTTKPGQFIDNAADRNDIVIGSKLATELYGSNQVLGRQLDLKGRTHTIVGTLNETDTPINLSGIDVDHAVFISFDDGKSFNQGVAQIQQMLITVKDPAHLEQARQAIEKGILANHKDEHDFSVFAGQGVAEHGNASFQAIVLVTAIVATVTLVVGGIGIMNIMLVGVSERTREIGIRKALGATNAHILNQFLIETLIMCFTGGITGLAAGYGLAFLVALQLSFQPAITWQIAATGLGMALSTGIVFGLYPAIKAARKDPIESLRQYH